MNVTQILLSLLYFVLSIVASVGGTYAAKLIKANTNLKYKNEIADAISAATACVQQTFVDKAKKEGLFDDAKQEEAREIAIGKATEMLSEGAWRYLNNGRDVSSVRDYLISLIEEAVRSMKKDG